MRADGCSETRAGLGGSAEGTLKLKTMRQPLKITHGKTLIFFSGFLGSGKMTFLWKNFSFQQRKCSL